MSSSFASAWVEWQQQLVVYLPKLLASLFIIILAFFVAFYFKKLILTLADKAEYLKHLIRFMGSVAAAIIIIIGIITALATAGVNVTALIASLGLLGFSLGMAFKDILANTIAGVMLIIYRPFTIEDHIQFKELTGIVKDINLRYTTLESDTNEKILIPNQALLNTPISVSTE